MGWWQTPKPPPLCNTDYKVTKLELLVNRHPADYKGARLQGRHWNLGNFSARFPMRKLWAGLPL